MKRAVCLALMALVLLAQLPVAVAEDETGATADSSQVAPSYGTSEESVPAGDEGPPPATDAQPDGAEVPSDAPSDAPNEPPTPAEPSSPRAETPSEPGVASETLVLSVGNASLDFGVLEPGATRTVAGPVIRITSGRPFDLVYRAHDFQRGVSVSHLSYRHEGGYVPFARSGLLESNHQAGTYEWQEMYQLQLGFDVPPGNYGTSITYTATSR